jgi:DedD protein
MAFFKFRKAAGEPQANAPAPESVDALRRRARYRLVGAAILVLAAVILFPLLFDSQPRPIAVDIPIDIPDKAKVKPLVNAVPVAEPSSAAQTTTVPEPQAPQVAAGSQVTAPRETQKEEVIVSPSKSAIPPAPVKTEPKVDAKPVKPVDKPATGRFIVQFGAFTDSARAHEARMKVEKTGLKTYAQVVDGPEGKKFRVRVGPFEKRADAEKAAEKIKKLDLPAAILGL